jgi:hypothetical protein
MIAEITWSDHSFGTQVGIILLAVGAHSMKHATSACSMS